MQVYSDIAAIFLQGAEICSVDAWDHLFQAITYECTKAEAMPEWEKAISALRLYKNDIDEKCGDWSMNLFCVDGLLSFPDER